MNKKGFEISFSWLFALIVGAFILFLAIYGVTKLIKSETTISDVKIQEEFVILMNPLETGFEAAKSSSISVPVETRVYNRCDARYSFGRQQIFVAQKTFGEWSQTNITSEFENKYIFSSNFEEGKKFFLFSMPFEFPFKVADLIFMSSENKIYCFNDEDIFDDLRDVDREKDNILFHSDEEPCMANEGVITVCSSGCEIEVNGDGEKGTVFKGDDYFKYYGDALMYAAIFSDKELYECQVQRVLKRVSKLSELYLAKTQITAGCSYSVAGDLERLKEAFLIETTSEIYDFVELVDEIDRKNKGAPCQLW